MAALHAWATRNLETQGYCLSAADAERLRVGLRFPTALCLLIVAAGSALQSAPVVLAAAAIGLVAGFTARHPFDLLWNHGVRRLFDAPELPPNPRRRRHAFKVGALWLLAIGALLAAGHSVAALVLGLPLMAACALVTATNFCVPSTILSLLEKRVDEERWPIQPETRS